MRAMCINPRIRLLIILLLILFLIRNCTQSISDSRSQWSSCLSIDAKHSVPVEADTVEAVQMLGSILDWPQAWLS